MTPHAPQNNGWMDPDSKGMWFHAGEVEALEAGLAKLEAENAAANATLDRLREVVPSREHWMHCCQCGMIMTPRPTLDIQECPNCFAMLQEIPGKLIAILYPTPENDNAMD